MDFNITTSEKVSALTPLALNADQQPFAWGDILGRIHITNTSLQGVQSSSMFTLNRSNAEAHATAVSCMTTFRSDQYIINGTVNSLAVQAKTLLLSGSLDGVVKAFAVEDKNATLLFSLQAHTKQIDILITLQVNNVLYFITASNLEPFFNIVTVKTNGTNLTKAQSVQKVLDSSLIMCVEYVGSGQPIQYGKDYSRANQLLLDDTMLLAGTDSGFISIYSLLSGTFYGQLLDAKGVVPQNLTGLVLEYDTHLAVLVTIESVVYLLYVDSVYGTISDNMRGTLSLQGTISQGVVLYDSQSIPTHIMVVTRADAYSIEFWNTFTNGFHFSAQQNAYFIGCNIDEYLSFDMLCHPCHPTCLSCAAEGKTSCTSCAAGHVYIGYPYQICDNSQNCPSSLLWENQQTKFQYFDGQLMVVQDQTNCILKGHCSQIQFTFQNTSQQCQKCFTGCLLCQGPSYNDCNKCVSNTVSQTVSSSKCCPLSTYYDAQKAQCLLCSDVGSGCFSCKQKTSNENVLYVQCYECIDMIRMKPVNGMAACESFASRSQQTSNALLGSVLLSILVLLVVLIVIFLVWRWRKRSIQRQQKIHLGEKKNAATSNSNTNTGSIALNMSQLSMPNLHLAKLASQSLSSINFSVNQLSSSQGLNNQSSNMYQAKKHNNSNANLNLNFNRSPKKLTTHTDNMLQTPTRSPRGAQSQSYSSQMVQKQNSSLSLQQQFSQSQKERSFENSNAKQQKAYQNQKQLSPNGNMARGMQPRIKGRMGQPQAPQTRSQRKNASLPPIQQKQKQQQQLNSNLQIQNPNRMQQNQPQTQQFYDNYNDSPASHQNEQPNSNTKSILRLNSPKSAKNVRFKQQQQSAEQQQQQQQQQQQLNTNQHQNYFQNHFNFQPEQIELLQNNQQQHNYAAMQMQQQYNHQQKLQQQQQQHQQQMQQFEYARNYQHLAFIPPNIPPYNYQQQIQLQLQQQNLNTPNTIQQNIMQQQQQHQQYPRSSSLPLAFNVNVNNPAMNYFKQPQPMNSAQAQMMMMPQPQHQQNYNYQPFKP